MWLWAYRRLRVAADFDNTLKKDGRYDWGRLPAGRRHDALIMPDRENESELGDESILRVPLGRGVSS